MGYVSVYFIPMQPRPSPANLIMFSLFWHRSIQQWKPNDGYTENAPISEMDFHHLVSILDVFGQRRFRSICASKASLRSWLGLNRDAHATHAEIQSEEILSIRESYRSRRA